MDSKFMRGEKGQAAVQVVIATAALVFIGITIIASIYSGAGVAFQDDYEFGNTTGNITSFTAASFPISTLTAHAPTCSNQTTSFTLGTVDTAAPSFTVGYNTGNFTFNTTYAENVVTDDVMTCDYYTSSVTGTTALTTLTNIEGYLWVGIGFLGLGLLVLGAVFVLRLIRQMGG